MSWFNRKPADDVLDSEQSSPEIIIREIAVPTEGALVYGFEVLGEYGTRLLGITIDPAEALSAGPKTSAILIRLYHLSDGTYVRSRALERVTLGLTKPEAQS